VTAEPLCACCGERPHGVVVGAVYIPLGKPPIPYVVCSECMQLSESERLAKVELRLDEVAGHA
jgi:hypothetical protein